MSSNVRYAVLASLCLGFAVGSVVAAQRASGASDPLDAVPRDSFFVATLQAEELRKSPVWEALLGADATRALGAGELAGACGFDPLMRVERAAFAVPEAGETGDFGVVARVRVTREELQKCTASLSERRGERAHTRESGSFTVLEDEAGKRGAIAYGAGGLLVVGRGEWLEAMMRAADRRGPRVATSEDHASLRRALTSRPGWSTPTVLASALLPDTLRARLKDEMGAEVGAADGSKSAMGGVLGVVSVGLAVRVGGTGKNVDAIAELRCETADGCKEVEKLILEKRLGWSRDITLRMLGFGELVDSLEAKADGTRLVATATARADGLAAALERLQKVRRSRPLDGAPRPAPDVPPTPPRGPQRAPDERLPAKPAPSR